MRISIIGSSGSGKTTLGRRLAAELGLEHVELDAVNWQPGWRDLNTHDPEEFVRRVAQAVSGDRWVTDGNYSKAAGPIRSRATDLVWLDYARPLIMSRVIRRSFLRAVSGDELWPGTGNRESFARWLQKDHPIRWAWDTYQSRRARNEALFADPALAHVNRWRLAHPREVEPLVAALKARG